MTIEWAEFEIRRLPGVYACIATPDEVAVLVEPAGDTEAVTDGATMILELLGVDQTLRVLGGGEPAVARSSFGRKVPVAVGVGGFAAMAIAGTVAALTGGFFNPFSSSAQAPIVPFPAAPAAAPPASHAGLLHVPGPTISALPAPTTPTAPAAPGTTSAGQHIVLPTQPTHPALPLLASGHTLTVSQLTPRLPVAIASVVAPAPVKAVKSVTPVAPVATPLVTFTKADEDHGKSKDSRSDDTHEKAVAHSSHSAHAEAD